MNIPDWPDRKYDQHGNFVGFYGDGYAYGLGFISGAGFGKYCDKSDPSSRLAKSYLDPLALLLLLAE